MFRKSKRDKIDTKNNVDLTIVKRDDKFGLTNREGHIIIPCQYESLEFVPYSKYIIARGYRGYGIFDIKGKDIVACFACSKEKALSALAQIKKLNAEKRSIINETKFAMSFYDDNDKKVLELLTDETKIRICRLDNEIKYIKYHPNEKSFDEEVKNKENSLNEL